MNTRIEQVFIKEGEKLPYPNIYIIPVRKAQYDFAKQEIVYGYIGYIFHDKPFEDNLVNYKDFINNKFTNETNTDKK